MEKSEILKTVDHTLLTVGCTESQIKEIIDDAIKYKTASVCIPPCFVKKASEYSDGRVKICTVIGFPNGYNTTEAKVFETKDAVLNGADEIDMVANINLIKEGEFGRILSEINQIKAACDGKLLKVIIETCLLTEQEKIKMCEVVSRSDADYIKTSTGFSVGGATKEDIILMRKNSDKTLKIKAAGGISSLFDAEEFLNLGADRLGTSRIVKIIKNEADNSGY